MGKSYNCVCMGKSYKFLCMENDRNLFVVYLYDGLRQKDSQIFLGFFFFFFFFLVQGLGRGEWKKG